MPDDPKPEGSPESESAPKPEAPPPPPAGAAPLATPTPIPAEPAATPAPNPSAPAATEPATIPPTPPSAHTPATTPAPNPPTPSPAAPTATPTPPSVPAPATTPVPKPPSPPAKPAAPPAPKPPAVMLTVPWESDLTSALAAEFGPAIPEFLSYLGQNFLVAHIDALVPLLLTLKDDFGFDYLVDVTAVHWPQRDQPFDIIYVLYSFTRNERIRIKLKIKETEQPVSATAVYPTANWLEREVYDMFGIEFADHPNMTRILLPDDWSTFPLRKENSILKMDQNWVQANLGIESGQ